MCQVLCEVIIQALCWSLWLEKNERVLEDVAESVGEVWDRMIIGLLDWCKVGSIHKEIKIFFLWDINQDWCIVLYIV